MWLLWCMHVGPSSKWKWWMVFLWCCYAVFKQATFLTPLATTHTISLWEIYYWLWCLYAQHVCLRGSVEITCLFSQTCGCIFIYMLITSYTCQVQTAWSEHLTVRPISLCSLHHELSIVMCYTIYGQVQLDQHGLEVVTLLLVTLPETRPTKVLCLLRDKHYYVRYIICFHMHLFRLYSDG